MKTISASFARKCFKKRKKDSHKGENGKVLVVGGCNDYVGAPALAAMAGLACMRTGVDLVTVLAPEKPGFVINSYSPNLVVKKVKGGFFAPTHMKKILEESRKADAVLIGNGMGMNTKTVSLVRAVVGKIKSPVVIDADAIKACKGMRFRGNVIITPHKREFEIFSGKKIAGLKDISELAKVVKSTAAKQRCIVLLKGRIDIISDGKEVLLNRTGCEAMTAAGTGDVLAGIVAALIARKNPLLDAAAAAAYINGKAGEGVAKKIGYSLVASDIIEKLPSTIKKTAG
jgi:NAD(P)H-hydrate epimerase